MLCGSTAGTSASASHPHNVCDSTKHENWELTNLLTIHAQAPTPCLATPVTVTQVSVTVKASLLSIM